MLILGRDIDGGFRYATSLCDLDLTFDLCFSEVDTWKTHWLGVLGVQLHGVTF